MTCASCGAPLFFLLQIHRRRPPPAPVCHRSSPLRSRGASAASRTTGSPESSPRRSPLSHVDERRGELSAMKRPRSVGRILILPARRLIACVPRFDDFAVPRRFQHDGFTPSLSNKLPFGLNYINPLSPRTCRFLCLVWNVVPPPSSHTEWWHSLLLNPGEIRRDPHYEPGEISKRSTLQYRIRFVAALTAISRVPFLPRSFSRVE